jgi:hypothetical protein
MVTAAVWSDFNNDSWPDLFVTGEWMPVRIFVNEKGKLVEQNNLIANQKTEGWWCSIFPADIDGDGDMDYFLGNAGTNLQFKASEKQPVQLNAADFNQDGTLDPVLTYYIKDQSYPLASRDEMLDQVASLRKKFIKYEDYAKATINDIATKEQLEKSYKFEAVRLESSWLENVNGREFKLKSLPVMSQLSSVNGFLHHDVDGDAKKELLVVGNFFPYKPQLGRSDASTGLVLNYGDGDLYVENGATADVWFSGDIRDIALLNFKNGEKRIVVSRNNDKAGVYTMLESR